MFIYFATEKRGQHYRFGQIMFEAIPPAEAEV